MEADVLVIGAGIVGLSIAYNLAEMGCKKIIVAEKEFAGAGTTGKGGGGIRHQFSTELNIKLTIESLNLLKRFKDLTGYDPQLKSISYYLLATEEEEALLRRSVDAQIKQGLHSTLIEPSELKPILKGVKLDDIAAVSTCREDSWINPPTLLQGYYDSCIRLGVSILEHTEVKHLRKEGCLRAETTVGHIDAETVVIAAGAYSGLIGKSIGVEIPIQPFKRQVFYVEGLDKVAEPNLVLFDLHNKVALVNRVEGPIVGIHDRSTLGSFDETLNLNDAPYVKEVAAQRIPPIKKAELTGGIAGLYEMTPDRNPIIGKIASVEGLFCAAGFSGHGIMHAPIIGKIIAEMIVKDKPSIDISQFSINRFSNNKQVYEHIVI
ncbi:MAG: FAD-binding oxidoreductase [Nitrososphaerales archaeon]